MKLVFGVVRTVLVLGILAAMAFLFFVPKEIAIRPAAGADVSGTIIYGNAASPQVPTIPAPIPTIPAASQPTSVPMVTAKPSTAKPSTVKPSQNYSDLPPRPKLQNPPAIVKGIYLTGWSAGSPSKMQSVINLAKNTELNAVVIDIKDYSGYVSYATGVPEVKSSGAENEIRITRPNALLKQLHENGIYVIGRVTSFQDPILAKAHPEWALRNRATGGLWSDNHGLAWIDPAAKPAWNYFAALTKDAFARGFDEVQFDYVRFASDGSLQNIVYPYWDEKTPMASVIANYFKFLRESFPNEKISADLFGLATVNNDDLGIGQVIQSAYQYFDYVSPMVYPSHYAPGFLGYKSPAKYPYEVIQYSMEHALAKLLAMGNTSAAANPNATGSVGAGASSVARPHPPFELGYIPRAKLRPWLQDFNLNGVPYTANMIRKEKQAVYDVLGAATSSQYYAGLLLWNASNNYTAAALDSK